MRPGWDAPPNSDLPDDGIRWLTDDEWDSPSCKRCLASILREEGVQVEDLRGEVLSPSGLWHSGKDGGTTRCGQDATPDGWWWPA